jgi:hypothetical protein
MLNVLKRCQKEIAEFPEEIRGEIADTAGVSACVSKEDRENTAEKCRNR